MLTSACPCHSIHVSRACRQMQSCNQVELASCFGEAHQFIDDYMLRGAKPLQAFVPCDADQPKHNTCKRACTSTAHSLCLASLASMHAALIQHKNSGCTTCMRSQLPRPTPAHDWRLQALSRVQPKMQNQSRPTYGCCHMSQSHKNVFLLKHSQDTAHTMVPLTFELTFWIVGTWPLTLETKPA